MWEERGDRDYIFYIFFKHSINIDIHTHMSIHFDKNPSLQC
jgi:hypothetical protein